MPREKKKSEKKKPEIIARFFRLARERAEDNGFNIRQICDKFHCSQATIYNYEDERRSLSYNQLHAYVEFYGIPAGVMLLITRLTAELRDGQADDAEKIARGIMAIANYVISNKATLGSRDYEGNGGGYQDQTLRELWDVYQTDGLYEPSWRESK